MEKVYLIDTNQKKAAVAMCASDKLDFKSKTLS